MAAARPRPGSSWPRSGPPSTGGRRSAPVAAPDVVDPVVGGGAADGLPAGGSFVRLRRGGGLVLPDVHRLAVLRAPLVGVAGLDGVALLGRPDLGLLGPLLVA